MEVWIAERESAVHPTPYPSIASQAKVTSSGPTMAENGVREPKLVADQEEPTSSGDTSSFYDWLPKRGTEEWIQYDFSNPTKVSSVDVYWFQQGGNEPIKMPASWRLLYKQGGEWKPVENTCPYGVEKGAYNQVAFKPVTTTAMRLEVRIQENISTGVNKWHVE